MAIGHEAGDVINREADMMETLAVFFEVGANAPRPKWLRKLNHGWLRIDVRRCQVNQPDVRRRHDFVADHFKSEHIRVPAGRRICVADRDGDVIDSPPQ